MSREVGFLAQSRYNAYICSNLFNSVFVSKVDFFFLNILKLGESFQVNLGT